MALTAEVNGVGKDGAGGCYVITKDIVGLKVNFLSKYLSKNDLSFHCLL
jgi:hypothetical protein